MEKYFKALNKHMKDVEKLSKLQKKNKKNEGKLAEARVRLATKKDVEFHGNIAQLIGKNHSMGLDKKSLAYLLRAIRQHTRMSFESKINEAKILTLPNGIKLKIDINGITLIDRRGKIKLDRAELQKFGTAVKKHMRIREDFAGSYPKEMRKKFDGKRRKQSEVLGYTLTGTDDVKTEIDDATIKEGKLNEVDFSKIKLPSQVNRFLDKFVQSMKDANLNRMKRAAILYKVIDASGMSVQQLMADIQKIKKELK